MAKRIVFRGFMRLQGAADLDDSGKLKIDEVESADAFRRLCRKYNLDPSEPQKGRLILEVDDGEQQPEWLDAAAEVDDAAPVGGPARGRDRDRDDLYGERG